MLNRIVLLLCALTLTVFSLTACNSDGPPTRNNGNQQNSGGNSPSNNNLGGTGKLELAVPSDPGVAWNSADSTTTVTVQYIVRDADGTPMEADQYETTLLIDDRPVSSEAMLNEEAEELEVNLYLSMVLDASSSMLDHTPPAFVPMTQAAADTYREAEMLWLNRPGETKFSAIWFNNLINQTHDDMATKIWAPSDLSTIPAPPSAGAFTKLYSAVSVMTSHLQAEYDNAVFNGPRDQYVMLVFSDGEDTYSHVANDEANPSQLLTTNSGASYHQFGTAATTLEATKTLINDHSNLTTHVIGLGSEINKEALQELATAGNGFFLENPSSEKIDELFDRVMKEFTTMQTNGVNFPFLPGEHKFTLQITNPLNGETASHDFRFIAGADARLVP